jgi:hypothetical protein
LLIYLRPMSLRRFQAARGSKGLKKTGVIDLSPDLSKDDVELRIDGNPIRILELSRVNEYAGGIGSIIAYLVQSTLPKRSIIAYLVQLVLPIKTLEHQEGSEDLRIDMTLRDRQTGERGEGCPFWKRQQTGAPPS